MFAELASRLEWVELVLGFSCNCRCVACPSWRVSQAEMSALEALAVLRLGHSRGATSLWLSGGEPTMYPALGGLLAHARAIGYRSIRLQTNGLRLAQVEFSDHLVEQGVTHVAVSLFGVGSTGHDQFTRRPGAYDLVLKALENLSGSGVVVEADVLVTNDSMKSLAEMVRIFVPRGVTRFWFWLISVHGIDTPKLDFLVPELGRAGQHIAAACEVATELGVEAWTLHTPPCALPTHCRDRYRHAGHWKLLVATPGGQKFMADQSPMEGGVFLPGCDFCEARPICIGLRADYLAVHGPGHIVPIRNT